MPCSKLGVKRGHCATIPLSLSIAAVEAVVAIEAGEATVEAALLLLLLYCFFLLYTSYEK